MLEENFHIFDLNPMWKDLLDYLVKCSKNASSMLEGSTFFVQKYITKDSVYDELFKEPEDALLECLTQECLEMICCMCSVMVESQLKDQLPGGKYFKPDKRLYEETKNCPDHNMAPERAFASSDRHLSMKPNMTTVAVAGLIMFSQNKTSKWLLQKSEKEVNFLVALAIRNKIKVIQDCKSKIKIKSKYYITKWTIWIKRK